MQLPRSISAVALFAAVACGDDMAALPGGSAVPLPYMSPDTGQSQWFVQQMGQLQQQGNQPVFSQAGVLTINAQHPQRINNTAELNEKNKELSLAFMSMGQVRITRRMKFEDGSPVRVIDTFDNPQDRDVTLNVSLMSNTNYGVNDSQTISDAKKKDRPLGWAASTGAERAAMSLFGGKGAKVLPTIQYQPNNNAVSATIKLTVPRRSKAALVHWHGTFDTAEAAVQWAAALKENRAIADLPSDLRRALVNVAPGGGGLPEGLELLRGVATDVVELTGGDTLRGDLGVETYALTTAYGVVSLPAAQVAGMVTADGRQWVVTTAGEIFAGRLEQSTIALTLAGGQTPAVPLSGVTRLGYRNPSIEQPEWKFDRPMAFLASGERFLIDPPATPVEFVTRYGTLTLTPEQVAAVLLPQAAAAQQVFLADGSRLSGVWTGGPVTLKPVASASADAAVFAPAALARVQWRVLPETVGSGGATIGLLGDDVVAARLERPLKLVTAFDTLSINGPEILAIARPRPGLPEVQVTTADGSTFRGTLAEPTLPVTLAGGATLTIPVAALRDYDNPRPYPAAGVVTKVTAAVGKLNADDWKERESAEAELTASGPSVIGVLEAALPAQPPEARDRLAAILKALKKDVPTTPSRLTPPPAIE